MNEVIIIDLIIIRLRTKLQIYYLSVISYYKCTTNILDLYIRLK